MIVSEKRSFSTPTHFCAISKPCTHRENVVGRASFISLLKKKSTTIWHMEECSGNRITHSMAPKAAGVAMALLVEQCRQT